MSTDKFPAIEAIAEVVQSHTGDKYLAGFFLAQLPRALLWFCAQGEAGTGTGKRHAEGPYRAPTWSWACVDGPVSFYNCYPDKGTHSKVLSEGQSIFAGGDFASLVDWKMDLVDSQNPFGQVKDAYIVLRGPLIELEVSESPSGRMYFKSSALLSRGEPLLHLDVTFEPAQMQPAFLPIFWHAWGFEYLPEMFRCREYGLVLVRSSAYDDGSYERIGIFESELEAMTSHVYQGDQEVRIR